jgi:hypothetical protein
MRRIIELPGGTVKPKVVSRVGTLDGMTLVCVLPGLLSASIPIGIDAQITQLYRELLGASLRGFGALLRGIGSQICGFGTFVFPLIVIAGQIHVVGKVKR